MITYRQKPIPLNIDGAIEAFLERRTPIGKIMQTLKPVLQFWFSYPGYGSKFTIAQSAFERRLLAAGYDLDQHRNGTMRVLFAVDDWLDPYKYGHDKNGRRTITPHIWPDKPIPFRIHPAWHDCEEAPHMGYGYLYLFMEQTFLKSICAPEPQTYAPFQNPKKLRSEFRDFMLDKVGITSQICAATGVPAAESDYLRYWRRAKLSFEESMENLAYLLETRREAWPCIACCDHILDFPVKIPASTLHWGSNSNATDSISHAGYRDD